MKNVIYLILFMPLLFGCSSSSRTDVDAQGSGSFDCLVAPEDAVSVDTAYADIARYKAYMNKFVPGDSNYYVRAFTMNAIDFIEALGLPMGDSSKVQFEFVRLYIALDELEKFKLYVTPVVGANLRKGIVKPGKDHILCQTKTDEEGNVVSQGGFMLDFAKPCPNTCPD